MQVTVSHINIPPMSTIGYGEGVGPAGETVTFVGDHRPMRHIGEAIAQATSREDLPVADLEDWQITGIDAAFGHSDPPTDDQDPNTYAPEEN